MLIETYLEDLSAGCCPNHVYALIFNEQGQALKLIGSVWQIANYVKSSHEDYCILLSEGSERTKYYSRTIPSNEHSLPVLGLGKQYTIEVWLNSAGENYSRSTDILKKTFKAYWDGYSFNGSNLSQVQIDSLSRNQVHIGVSYDSSTDELKVVAWLERNSLLVSAVNEIRVRLLSRTGSTLCDVAVNSQLEDVPGVFAFDIPSISLPPDEAFIAVAIITDEDSVLHTSVTSILSWD